MQRWEERFEEVARYMGVDTTADNAFVPFNATDPRYMDAWLHMVLAPLAQQGIDGEVNGDNVRNLIVSC